MTDEQAVPPEPVPVQMSGEGGFGATVSASAAPVAEIRTVMIKGPLTDDELGQIIKTMQQIEGGRPGDTFHMFIDSPETDEAADKLLARINPSRPGYSRILITRTDE